MERGAADLPERVTAYYASLAQSLDPATDPIAAQFVPRPEEQTRLDCETADPLSDRLHEVVPRVIHRYRDRVLILASDSCAVYCRHCFRRHFTAGGAGLISREEVAVAAAYLAAHSEVREAIVSGGDPLLLGEERIQAALAALRDAREDVVLRVATRVPVVDPARVTERLAGALGRLAPVWVVTQANHPREVTPAFAAAIDRLLRAGVPVLNQAVLLRGVNADAGTLEALFRALVRARVKPYYLFQGDLAAGTHHFRTSVDEGLAIMRELRTRLSGLSLPVYAVDLPGGGGKVELTEASVVRREPGWYVLRGPNGGEHRYPMP